MSYCPRSLCSTRLVSLTSIKLPFRILTGGWMQVAAKHVPVSSLIIGVDLIPIRPIRGTQSIVGDITTEKCTKLIEKASKSQLFDIVLNDGAPNVGGAWHSESLSQAILVLDALKLATKFLVPNGWFITKVQLLKITLNFFVM